MTTANTILTPKGQFSNNKKLIAKELVQYGSVNVLISKGKFIVRGVRG